MSVSKRILDNGLTLVCQTRSTAETTAVGIYWLAGSRFETPAEAGAAHFLEHLMLAERGAERALLGDDINAATGRELISLTGTVPAHRADALLSYLRDALCRPAFTAWQREQSVLRVEQALESDTLLEVATAMAWGEHPLGRSIIGDPRTPPGVEVLRHYWQRMLTGGRLWLLAVGPQPLEWWQHRVGELARLPPTVPAPAETVPSFRGGRFRRQGAGMLAQALWLMPVPGAAQGVDHGLLILSRLLGGGGDSRLSQRLREQRGWVYAIDGWLEQYRDAGLWAIATTCEAQQRERLEETLELAVAALLRDPPGETELRKLRQGLEARLLLDEANPAGCLARLARETIYLGTPMDISAHRAGLAAVDSVHLQTLLGQSWPAQLRLSLQ